MNLSGWATCVVTRFKPELKRHIVEPTTNDVDLFWIVVAFAAE